MFRVQVYKDDTLATGARIALRSRLYVSGWALAGCYVDMMNDQLDGEIALGFLDGEPICAIVNDFAQVMAFCRKALRGNGYTSRCLQRIDTSGLIADTGVEGSAKFWQKNSVKLYPWVYV